MLLNDFDHCPKQYHEPHSLSPCILILNGFPGVGKLTIAKALEVELKLNGTPYRLIDNHLLIDPVVAIEPIRNKAHYALRKSFRKAAFEGLMGLKEGLVIIFTTALSTSHLPTPYDDIDHFREYLDIAETRGIPLVVFSLTCDLGTNSGRLCSRERKEVGGKTKLVDVEILERLRQDTSLLDREQAMACKKRGDMFYFELNTSDLAVEQVTQKVWEYLYEVLD